MSNLESYILLQDKNKLLKERIAILERKLLNEQKLKSDYYLKYKAIKPKTETRTDAALNLLKLKHENSINMTFNEIGIKCSLSPWYVANLNHKLTMEDANV